MQEEYLIYLLLFAATSAFGLTLFLLYRFSTTKRVKRKRPLPKWTKLHPHPSHPHLTNPRHVHWHELGVPIFQSRAGNDFLEVAIFRIAPLDVQARVYRVRAGVGLELFPGILSIDEYDGTEIACALWGNRDVVFFATTVSGAPLHLEPVGIVRWNPRNFPRTHFLG